MRKHSLGVMAILLAFTLAAHAQQGGVTADGWEVRLDRGSDASGVLSFAPMGTGVHATTGPAGAAVFYQAKSMAKGDFTISGEFTLMEPANHRSGYGLILGGADLSGPDQQYTYFLVAQTGEYIIKRRMGAKTVDVANWTANPAVNQPNGNGSSMNTLSVQVEGDQVRFLVNGTTVATQPRSAVDVDGQTGVRVNHFLNVHVDKLQLGM